MLFSRQLPLKALIEMCHISRLSLAAGLTLRDVFRQLATRSSRTLQPVAERMRARLEQGESFRDALKPEEELFPPLFLAMAAVGEKTGNLAEVMHELEKYFTVQQKCWRQIRSRSVLPVVQFIIAVGVIALLLVVLGMISQTRGTQPAGFLGLRGVAGAVKFVVGVVALFAAVFAVYLVVTRVLQQRTTFDRFVLRLPDIGSCVQALVVARFALALQLTLDSALAIGRALRYSLAATGNAAFVAQTDVMVAAVGDGEPLTVALSRAQVFPADFLNMIAVAEEGGRIVEMLRHQARHYQEEGERRLKALTAKLTYMIWMLYVVFMVVAILQLAGTYLGALGI